MPDLKTTSSTYVRQPNSVPAQGGAPPPAQQCSGGVCQPFRPADPARVRPAQCLPNASPRRGRCAQSPTLAGSGVASPHGTTARQGRRCHCSQVESTSS